MSLTQIAIGSRKIIRYSFFGIIGFILIRALILTGVSIYRTIHPEPPPSPTVSFGKLPKIPFPSKDVPEKLNFTLQTPDGELPAFFSQARVYLIVKPSSSQLSLDMAKERADALGFSVNEKAISETLYSFENGKTPVMLEMNIINKNFSISYDLTTDPTPLSERPPAPEIAVSDIKSYLSSAQIAPKDLIGPAKTEFIKADNGKLVGTISLSDSNFIKVNLFRKNYKYHDFKTLKNTEIPSLTQNPNQANVWFIVSGSREREKQIIAGEYRFFEVDEKKFATYPLKTTAQAWEELKNKNAYFANIGNNPAGDIIVRRVYLAYYDPDTSAEFFQPIFVFEGDNNFQGYVPAVSSELYGE